MTIEEKAKAYDEAIKIMTEACNTNKCSIGFMKKVFPKFVESKEERIRKTLYGWVCTEPSSTFDNGFTKEEILTWLEKRKSIDIIINEIEKRIDCFKTEKSKEGASQIDRLSFGGRIVALEELLCFIKTGN